MRGIILAVTGLAFAVVAACGSYGTSVVEVENQQQAQVASVVVTLPSPSLPAGQRQRASVTLKDASGAALRNRPILWYTSATSVATVTDSGEVVAVAPGAATLSAVSEGVAGQAALTVIPRPPAPVAKVLVAINPAAIVVGQTAHATVALEDSIGNPLTDRPVTWQSSNTSVATVSGSGDISAVAPGTAAITAASEGKTASASLSVSAPAPIPVATVSVSPTTSSVQVGATVQLSATTRDASNNVLTGRAVAWSSANTGVASVNSNGLVSAVTAGTVQITASSEGKTSNATITVTPLAPVPVATVTVSPASSNLIVGATVQLTATMRDASNNVLTGRQVTWSSSNTTNATVNSIGLVTAVSTGTAQITASSEGQSNSAAITITAPAPAPVATVTVSPASSSILVGATVQLSATMRDANNNLLTGRVVAWSSADPSIASVNSASGLVTAVGVGSTTINAISETQIGTATVGVQAAPPPPPPPPSGSSNEPTGMTRITERPFNSLNENAAWDTDNSLSIVQDATAPKSPSSVLRATFSSGFGGGSSPGHAGVPHTSYRVLYISFWSKYSANWQGHLTSVNKQLYQWANNVAVFYFEARGTGSGSLTPSLVIQGSPGSDGVHGPNLVSGATFTRGQWDHVEIVLTGNTSGTANGSADWYLNGVHVGRITGKQFTSGTTGWNQFEFRPVWGGVGGTVSSTMTLDWDHLYLSGKN
jgi:uncharacterized protein YjdB